MNYKNPIIILFLLSATIASFVWGGYYALNPFFFMSGLFLISTVCFWASQSVETSHLIKLTLVTMLVAFIDEYAHTSSGVFAYYDGMTPSPLTVFGWCILVLGIIYIAQFLYRKVSLMDEKYDSKSILLVLITGAFLIISVWAQGYHRFFNPLMIVQYFFLFGSSLYYSKKHKINWILWIFISTLVLSSIMEYLGGIEGLWIYQFNNPMALFIVFTWVLRIMTILTVSSVLDIDIW